jgi:hypothetical protein
LDDDDLYILYKMYTDEKKAYEELEREYRKYK